jgi:hypothetical protein
MAVVNVVDDRLDPQRDIESGVGVVDADAGMGGVPGADRPVLTEEG